MSEDGLAGWSKVCDWCLGGEEFRQELLAPVDARPGPSHFVEAVQEAEAAQAERLVVEALKRMRWSEAVRAVIVQKPRARLRNRRRSPIPGSFHLGRGTD